MGEKLIPTWLWWWAAGWALALILFPQQIFEGVRYLSVPFYALALALGGH